MFATLSTGRTTPCAFERIRRPSTAPRVPPSWRRALPKPGTEPPLGRQRAGTWVRPLRVASVEVASPESGQVDVSEQVASESSTFSWTSRWWPAVTLDSLDTKIPKHVDLLGKSLVVWADSKGSWHCLEDRCPHRNAPLSEGRVEKDTIMCCYHGWCFSGSGACARIPQLETDPKVYQVACSNRRSTVNAYPTRVEHGVLWVWPEAGEAAAATAAATPVNEAVQSDGRTPWFVRHLPIRFDTLLENIVDPTHVPFAHHGVQGNRNQPADRWSGMTCSPVGLDGYTATTQAKLGPITIEITAPSIVKYPISDRSVGLQVMCVPTKPGWSAIWSSFLKDVATLPWPNRLLHKAKMAMVAVDHATNSNPVIDGDTYMLHCAERLMPVSGGVGMAAAAKAYYLPGRCDNAVIALRKWLQQFGGNNIPTCSPGDEALMPPVMTKEQVLDRWSQHTKDCKYCLGLLAALDRTRVVAAAVGALAAVVAVASAVAAAALPHLAGFTATATSRSTSSAVVPAGLAAWWQAAQSVGLQQVITTGVAVALLALWVHTWLGSWRQNFFYKEYVHALK